MPRKRDVATFLAALGAAGATAFALFWVVWSTRSPAWHRWLYALALVVIAFDGVLGIVLQYRKPSGRSDLALIGGGLAAVLIPGGIFSAPFLISAGLLSRKSSEKGGRDVLTG